MRRSTSSNLSIPSAANSSGTLALPPHPRRRRERAGGFAFDAGGALEDLAEDHGAGDVAAVEHGADEAIGEGLATGDFAFGSHRRQFHLTDAGVDVGAFQTRVFHFALTVFELAVEMSGFNRSRWGAFLRSGVADLGTRGFRFLLLGRRRR